MEIKFTKEQFDRVIHESPTFQLMVSNLLFDDVRSNVIKLVRHTVGYINMIKAVRDEYRGNAHLIYENFDLDFDESSYEDDLSLSDAKLLVNHIIYDLANNKEHEVEWGHEEIHGELLDKAGNGLRGAFHGKHSERKIQNCF